MGRSGERASWTIDGLGEAVADALSVGYGGQASGRVREVPDQRTIRYYTTLGLIDRPAMRGRTALYGRRHLLQLVAIKRLQAEGQTLAEIQHTLQGVPHPTLERIARVPEAGGAADVRSSAHCGVAPASLGQAKRAAGKARGVNEAQGVTPPAPKTGRALGAFWTEGPAEAHALPKYGDDDEEVLSECHQLAGFCVRDDVTLLFPPGRALDDEDAEALREALEPIVRLLIRRGLMKSPADRER